MKLKCNHDRRAMVLPSGNTVHRSDGTYCHGRLSIGGNKVTKSESPVTLTIHKTDPASRLLREIFEKKQ